MTHVVQIEAAVPDRRPLEYVGTRPSWIPVAQQIFRADGLSVDAVGVGDTGGFGLEFILPTNWVYVLRRFTATLRGDDEIAWDGPTWRYFWSPEVTASPAATIQVDQVITSAYSVAAPESGTTGGTFTYFEFGGGAKAHTDINTNMSNITPLGDRMPPLFGGYGAGISPQFGMHNPTPSSAEAFLSYICIWDIFPVSVVLDANFNAAYRSY